METDTFDKDLGPSPLSVGRLGGRKSPPSDVPPNCFNDVFDGPSRAPPPPRTTSTDFSARITKSLTPLCATRSSLLRLLQIRTRPNSACVFFTLICRRPRYPRSSPSKPFHIFLPVGLRSPLSIYPYTDPHPAQPMTAEFQFPRMLAIPLNRGTLYQGSREIPTPIPFLVLSIYYRYATLSASVDYSPVVRSPSARAAPARPGTPISAVESKFRR